jgi:chaperonin GroEL
MPELWRSTAIYRYKSQEIKQIKFADFKNSKNSWELIQNNNQFILKDYEGKSIANFDTLKAREFLTQFNKVNCEGFVNDIEPTTLQTIINNKVANPQMFNIMFVEHDGFGDRRIEIMNDIAAMTGASVGTAEDFGDMGFAKEVIVNEDSTSILGGTIEESIVNRLVEETQYKLTNDDLDEDQRKYYRRRLATLKGGVAVIHVGGITEVEMKEKKDRIDDAVEAVKSAIDRGISVGGGHTFISICNSLNNMENKEGEQIIINSLIQPFIQLCNNADSNSNELLTKLILNSDMGYNVINNELIPLDEYNVYDPTGVLIDALSNAVAVAKSILSVECSLYNY